jgi:hypothetical protein
VYGNARVCGNAQVYENKDSKPYTHILGSLWREV